VPRKVRFTINLGFPYLWVNGEKYSFSQEVLDHGSRLMIEFFKLEHCLRDLYGKVTQEPVSINVDLIIVEIK
jgi:formyltetrahydrofolate hydrolase